MYLEQAFFFTKFLEDFVGPTLRQAEFFVLSFEFFSYSEFFGLRTLNRASDNLSFLGQGHYIGPPTV